MTTLLHWTWLGRRDHAEVAALQEQQRDRILAGEPDAERLYFVEHPPVVTLGRRADLRHLVVPPAELAARGVALERATRGGDVTAHGPGQLVVYPVVRLLRGVVAHVESIGRALAEEAAAHGVDAEFRRDPAGVWAGDAKLAACGIHVKRRVAIHGFALNVTDEALAPFALIVPCGLAGVPVTSLTRLGAAIDRVDSLCAPIAMRITRAWSRTPVQIDTSMSITTCDRLPAR